MTFLGKLLLMINLAFSLVMGVAAFGLWANNLDYGPEAKGKSQQPPAKVTATAKEITELVATRGAVEGSWRSARAELLKSQAQRQAELVWYANQLKVLQHGDPTRPGEAAQLRAVVLDKHLPVVAVGAVDPLQMAPVNDAAGQPLNQASVYLTKLKAARESNADVLANLNKELLEDQRLTNLLTGTPEKKGGLRQQIIDERLKAEGIEAEINSVRPLFINIAVETDLVRKRLDSLQERIAELKTYLRTKHKLDVAMRSR
jgi:hypothetical protein